MRLYFVRHGFASWPAWTGDDAERPLTADGARLMAAAAAGLARRLKRGGEPAPKLILHSPLVRARQTAEILAGALKLDGRLREHRLLQPGFDPQALKALLREHPRAGALMLVGHNPDMAEVVGHLADRPVKFKEGTVACLQLREPDRARLVWVAAADELAAEK